MARHATPAPAEPWRARAAGGAGDGIKERREQKHHERCDDGQSDRAAARDAQHHDRNTVDETDEDEHRNGRCHPLDYFTPTRKERRTCRKQKRPGEEISGARDSDGEGEREKRPHDQRTNVESALRCPPGSNGIARCRHREGEKHNSRRVQPAPHRRTVKHFSHEPPHDGGQHDCSECHKCADTHALSIANDERCNEHQGKNCQRKLESLRINDEPDDGKIEEHAVPGACARQRLSPERPRHRRASATHGAGDSLGSGARRRRDSCGTARLRPQTRS